MKITDIKVDRFWAETSKVQDEAGHAHPGKPRRIAKSLCRVMTDVSLEGYAFSGDKRAIEGYVRDLLVGEDPLARERIWKKLNEHQRMRKRELTDSTIAAVDMALWDFF